MNRLSCTTMLVALWAAGACAVVSGCEEVGDLFKTDLHRFLSPDKVIAPPERQGVRPILLQVGMTDAMQERYPGSVLPTREDLTYDPKDYAIGPTDVLDISILDLFQEGLETVLRRQVSDGGWIDLPLIPDRIKAQGLTADQLKEWIKQDYSPGVLRDPTVSVTVIARRQSTFSVLGAVARPNTYNILRRDMRLMEALALSGGIVQMQIRYIYVIRPAPAIIQRGEEQPPAPGVEAQLPPLPTVPTETTPALPQPGATMEQAVDELRKALGGTEAPTQPAPELEQMHLPTLADMAPGASAPASAPEDLTGAAPTVGWIYSGGRWIRTDQSATALAPGQAVARSRPTTSANQADPFGWASAVGSDLAQIIAINVEKLGRGNPRMNIVIRDNDIIQVPPLKVGEFYVMGEVLRPGVYSLTGRRVTLKMAMAAAGNLAPLAWPENSILIRRIGDSEEQTIPIDVEAIFKGEENDIFLKPDDVIAVGTDVRSSFMAVVRNAFRMTYGFGFIYDRNFADPLLAPVTSRRFTRW